MFAFKVILLVSCAYAALADNISGVSTDICPDNTVTYPVEEDCKGFYQCATAGLVPKLCPNDQYYNCETKTCDATAISNCCPRDPNFNSRSGFFTRMLNFFRR